MANPTYRIEPIPERGTGYALFEGTEIIMTFDHLEELPFEVTRGILNKVIPPSKALSVASFIIDSFSETLFVDSLAEFIAQQEDLSILKLVATTFDLYGDAQAPSVLLCKGCKKSAAIFCKPLVAALDENTMDCSIEYKISRSFYSKQEGHALLAVIKLEESFSDEDIKSLTTQIEALPLPEAPDPLLGQHNQFCNN